MLPSDLFNALWEKGTITKPIVILIGGYAGTGKSTLAANLSTRLPHAQTIPTGIFRSIAQSQDNAANNPALFLPTYDLHSANGSKKSEVMQAYEKQCEPVTSIINSVISFMAIEKQHLIIDGNHILPWRQYGHDGCYVIELYMYVKDASKHREMLGGPTHNRTISDTQFNTGRMIHDALYLKALPALGIRLLRYRLLVYPMRHVRLVLHRPL